jgi:nucleotide-binding universal stress UspA family protein
MKNVLLLVHRDAGQEARLKAALDLTRAFSGHLCCMDVTPLPQIFDTGWAPPVILDETEQEKENRSQIRRRLSAENVSWSWMDMEGDFADCLLRAAKWADLIVLNRKFHIATGPNMLSIASRVLTHCDALVVAVDEKCRGLKVGAPALVAWDGSEKASQAPRRAVPLLALSNRVIIFQAGPLPRDALSATEVVEYLSRQGIAAKFEVGPETNDPAADICAAAKRFGTGYCVMGAYGHSRLHEAFFGGVSRRMLDVANIPLIMAH